MKFKTVDVGGSTYAELKDGALVVTLDDGKDGSYTEAQISRLSGEAMGHRKRFEAAESRAVAAEEKLKTFEGIEDPETARKALEFQRNVKDGEFIAAGKAEEMKSGLTRTFEEKYAAQTKAGTAKIQELETKLRDVAGRYDQEVVGNAFANSKFIRDRTAVPLKMIQATFGVQFKNENGVIVGRHAGGELIVGTDGNPAKFDDAFERIVEAFPDKDMILKGNNQQGSGARAATGASSGAKTMAMSAFKALDPISQATMMSAKDRPTLVDG